MLQTQQKIHKIIKREKDGEIARKFKELMANPRGKVFYKQFATKMRTYFNECLAITSGTIETNLSNAKKYNKLTEIAGDVSSVIGELVGEIPLGVGWAVQKGMNLVKKPWEHKIQHEAKLANWVSTRILGMGFVSIDNFITHIGHNLAMNCYKVKLYELDQCLEYYFFILFCLFYFAFFLFSQICKYKYKCICVLCVRLCIQKR